MPQEYMIPLPEGPFFRDGVKKQTNAESLHANYERLKKWFSGYWIAICDGIPILIEHDHDKFNKMVEKEYHNRKVLQAYIPVGSLEWDTEDEDLLELDAE